jgi:hypothetical protein
MLAACSVTFIQSYLQKSISKMISIARIVAFSCAAIAAVVAHEDATKFVADQTVFKSDGLNTTSHGWTEYKQCDSRWGSQQLGTCGGTTICSAGCAMSSVAMIIATKGGNYNPGNLDSWLTSNGGYSGGCNINWASVDKLGYTSFVGKQSPTESEICNGLSAGHGLVANVHNGGHWVLLTGCLGGGVFAVNDPGYSTTSYKYSDIVDLAVYH